MEIEYCLITKTIPEYNNKRKSLYTCSIGYSPQLGLIRVYPIPIVKDFNSGFVYKLDVEKRKTDSRFRSYELIGAYENKPRYMKIRPYNYSMLWRYIKDEQSKSISELNKRKDSIGLIPLKDYRLYWDNSSRYVNTDQLGLFEDAEIKDFTKYTKDSRTKEARILFKDADGKHDLQYNEWGIYEFGRKFGNKPDAFRYTKNATHVLVGNMLQFQSTWMALKALNLHDQVVKTPSQIEIFQ
jgi:hypothetical protein